VIAVRRAAAIVPHRGPGGIACGLTDHGGVIRRLALLAVALLLALPLGADAAAPRTWHLVALGDSIPFGGRYCGNCTPYPTLLARTLAHRVGSPIAVRNLGVPGLTTAQLLDRVRTRSDVRTAIAGADIVTVTIGHNDTPWNSRHDSCDGAHAWFGPYRDARFATYTGPCLTTEANALRSRLRSVLATIRSLRGTRSTLILVTTDWNQLIGKLHMTAAGVTASKAVLDRFASVTCAAATAYGARCADVYHAFNGSTGLRSAGAFLAPDHDHASQRGHQVIADLLARFPFVPSGGSSAARQLVRQVGVVQHRGERRDGDRALAQDTRQLA
jgi:lysophospholipase L1-like esterase